MFFSRRGKSSKSQTTSPVFDDDGVDAVDVDIDVELDTDVDIDAVDVPAQKRHFLDYATVPPPDFEENFKRTLSFTPPINTIQNVSTNHSAGEELKMDKKYERDGEISDYELAASGYTKKEFTQDDNTLHLCGSGIANAPNNAKTSAKPKHFLDENPIAPDYMIEQELREHRSLDRNFERHNEQKQQQLQRTESPASSLAGVGGAGSSNGGGGGGVGGVRKNSLDRMSLSSRSSRERFKEQSYTLSRFLDNNQPQSSSLSLQLRVPKGEAWTDNFNSRYSSLQLPPPNAESDTLGPKVECVYSLLSMLGSNDPLEMAKKFLELSRTPETCVQLRHSGCIPLLVQMMHSEGDENVRKMAGMSLHNVAHSHPDERAGRRETKVLRLLDQIIDYCNFLKTLLQSGGEAIADDSDRHPLAAMSSLMKISFDEEHRHAMCELGALQAIPNLMHLDHAVHGPKPEDQCCNSLRRYALMALTNLTFGDEKNKALLCSQKLFMEALVAQLDSAPDDLLQVTASVLRNLSWRADANMKSVLNEIGTVTALARAAMKNKSENTLKAILSALWNLSAHCSTNKAEFCAVDGALAFLVDMLTYEGPSKTLKIIENAGGILRNVSSHIAVREHYRQILRERNCLAILLQQLKSESLTVVSNSCGTLWNLSARCPEDQKFLWDNGAVPMLRSLIHSKHAMISEGSSSALKNLLNFRPAAQNPNHMDHIARSMGLKKLPTLNARKQKALEQELEAKEHSETCDNLDIVGTNATNENTNLETVNATSTTSLSQRRYPLGGNVAAVVATYQETDLDQPTDFSLRYAENQIESDTDITPPEVDAVSATTKDVCKTTNVNGGNEILLILEDTVKCYQTEDTPYVISNAASVTDLRHVASKADSISASSQNESNKADIIATTTVATAVVAEISVSTSSTHPTTTAVNHISKKYQRTPMTQSQPTASLYGPSGTFTPEKPINYCEEGTPGYFSRYESLSSLDESPPSASANDGTTNNSVDVNLAITAVDNDEIIEQKTAEITNDVTGLSSTPPPPPPRQKLSQVNTPNIINSAQETPLMFSRRSSMDSLVEEDVGPLGDDKSSVVSDFSRLASGVISPSELPDSPTQSMPQSPRRNSDVNVVRVEVKRPLRSVFEDNLNRFNVENTPAQFSCATSLSNLSILDDEHQLITPPTILNENEVQEEQQERKLFTTATLNENQNSNIGIKNIISEGEEEEEEESNTGNNDDILLASCINIGMNRTTNVGMTAAVKNATKATHIKSVNTDEAKQYFTEDTPALLSKVGSNTNLSAISICSSSNNNEEKLNNVNNIIEAIEVKNMNRQSLNLSDDISSNASESGAAAIGGVDILQQCIRDGMKKPLINKSKKLSTIPIVDPIAMMRKGGNILPPYLPVTDEMNKYLVEDSPCNFSVVSGLSNLTVGSSLVGPAVQLQGNNGTLPTVEPKKSNITANTNALEPLQNSKTERQQWHDDSLSSLSIDSEDDTNLLSQAIAAGCNRPKSNLGFSTTSSSKYSTSLSSSQPIPINSATSASSLTSAATTRAYQRQQRQHHHAKRTTNGNDNESCSSIDSSDSNDNQSKSLFELCILTGMHKSTRELPKSRKHHHSHTTTSLLSQSRDKNSGIAATSTQSNPNLKQYESLPTQTSAISHHNRQQQQQQQQQQHQQQQHHTNQLHGKPFTPNRHLRERERKDEKLLMECINTGISKKIGTYIKHGRDQEHTATSTHLKSHEQIFNVPKNGQTTSAAALEAIPPMADTILQNVHNIAITATAPDVEKNKDSIISTSIIRNNIIPMPSSIIINEPMNIMKQCNNIINQDIITDITIDVQKNQAKIANVVNHQNHVNVPEIMKNNDIGFETSIATETADSCNSLSLDNTVSSDDSNESNISFIMDTAVSLDNNQSQSTVITADKHKDPDLMLKSVERLTLEFVTSAELLRSNSDSNEHNKRQYNSISTAATNSNNTWNEETCPNDVSFPSVSISAPVIESLEDDCGDVEQATEADHHEICDFAEITPTNEAQPQPSMSLIIDETYIYNVNGTQPNSIDSETETKTLTKDITITESNSGSNSSGINFKLGGEVQSAAHITTHQQQNLYFNSMNNMTNSAIIAIEARALAEHLQNDSAFHINDDDNSIDLTYSVNSLDLDNIRPPSGMESLNYSGYYQDFSMAAAAGTATTQPNSLQRSFLPQSPLNVSTRSPKFPRKSLPAGLMARRALGQLSNNLAGSVESVNSSCNLLDNIKPPSLMDELLDSMISVASIQSEIAECESMATTISLSNYETATGGVGVGVGVNEFDDNTITLQSCCDQLLPHDDENDDDEATVNGSNTPLPSDELEFSSAESTPRKTGKRTPKQKRQMEKDRFKTYTIAADEILKKDAQEDEVLQIEIVENIRTLNTSGCSPKQSRSGSASRRRSSQDRYRTQTIVYSSQNQIEVAENMSSLTSTDDCLSDEISSIRAMTQKFTYITAPLQSSAAAAITTTVAQTDLKILDCEQSSIECDQNSETESCHGQSQQTSDIEHELSDSEIKIETKARITKPNMECELRIDEDTFVNEEAKKVIRGRKKPAYVSPYSMSYQRNNNTTRLATNKTIATTNILRKNNTKITPSTKLVEKKKLNDATEVTEQQSPALQRQGTFVKEESTIAATEIPIVDATLTNVIAQSSPTRRSAASKLPTKLQTITSPKMTATTATNRKIPTTTTGLRKFTKTSTTSNSAPPKRANTNSHIQRNGSNSARIAMLSTRVSTTTPPSRSNSTLNNTTAATATQTATSKINQAQSRIASIWKRVDEAKTQQHQKTPKQQQQIKANTQKLVRSSTFDSKPDGAAAIENIKPTKVNTATKKNHTGATTSVIASKIAINRNIINGNKK